MFFSLRSLKLNHRMVLVLGLMALLQTGSIGLFALHYLNQSLDEQLGLQAQRVAKSIAAVPEIITQVEKSNSDFLQPLSLILAREAKTQFVVFGDRDGMRLSHPNPSMIGLSLMSDDGQDLSPVIVHGKDSISKADGSIGWTMRARVPVYDLTGEEVVGMISVGYLLDQVESIIAQYRLTLILVILAAFTISVITALWFANHFKKAIFGLEPEQIARFFEERNATLESIREGIIAINSEGRITTINRTAIDTLGLSEDTPLDNRMIDEVLPDSNMLEVLQTGVPQFDQEVWLSDRNLIVNRLPLKRGDTITGAVSSFRRKDELDLISRKLTRIQQYADSLHSQSHEYANKLHTISGLIQIAEYDKALELIGQETQGHQELIRLLLKTAPDPILSGCLLGKYNRARELGLNLAIDANSQMTLLPDDLPREPLVSILGNLIDNALEATLSHKGIGGTVRIFMMDIGRDLIFEIEDQGKGVTEQEYEKIFEKGVSSKTDTGHGLGLYLVNNLLKNLGGSIAIEPLDGGGSRFTAYIPKKQNATREQDNSDK